MNDEHKLKRASNYDVLFARIEPDLHYGEQVLWAGQPTAWRTLLPYSESLVGVASQLFMLVVILDVFDVIGFFPDFRLSPFSPFVLFIVGSLLISLAWLPLSEFVRSFGTIYAITTERAIISKPGFGGRALISFGAVDIDEITRRSGSAGRGDVLFYSENYTVNLRNRGVTPRERRLGFFGVTNARYVEELLIDTFKRQ